MESEWTAKQVRKQAHLEDLSASNSKTGDMLNDYATILDKQARAEPFGYVETDADTFVKHWHGMTKPFGSLAVYTHPAPPINLATVRKSVDQLREACRTSNDCAYGTLSTSFVGTYLDDIEAAIKGVA